MSVSTITAQANLRGNKTITTGSSQSRQTLDPSIISRLTQGTGSAQVDEIATLEETVVGDTNELQTITVAATGGTFTVAFNGSPASGALAFDITAGALQTALEGLTTIGVGDVSVTGGPGDETGSTPYVIEFTGALAAADQPALVTNDAGLTGGASTANVATTRQGAAAANTDLDLTALLDGFDDPVSFQQIKAILVVNRNTADGEILSVGGSGPANPWEGWGGIHKVYPGPDSSRPGFDYWHAARNDADNVVDASNKVLRLASAKNRIEADIYIVGIAT